MNSLSEYQDYYELYHSVKICRERCLEQGYYGEALNVCIEECVKEIKSRS